MKVRKKVFNENDVSGLKSGDYIIINGKSAMKRRRVGDGMEYIINNGDRTLTRINLRGYCISNGGITPVWYSEEIIDSDKYRSRR